MGVALTEADAAPLGMTTGRRAVYPLLLGGSPPVAVPPRL